MKIYYHNAYQTIFAIVMLPINEYIAIVDVLDW